MKKKRFIIRITALLIIFAMIGACTPTQTQTPEAPVEEAPAEELSPIEEWAKGVNDELGGTEIKIAAASHPSTEAFKKMTPRFEEITGIKVVIDEMEEGALGQKLLLEMSAPTSDYDIIMSYPEAMPSMVDAEYLMPLDEFIQDSSLTPDWYDYEDILQPYRDMLAIEGKHYGVPFAGETVFLFYQCDLFEEHGREVPKTMDELKETAAYFQENVEGVAGLSWRTRVGWEMTYMWSVFIFPFGGEMLDPTMTTPGFNKPETIASLQYMIDMMEYAPPGVESFSFSEAWDAFMQGKTAMMVEASAAAPEVENPEKSVIAGNVCYAPMPAGPAGAYSGVWGWGYGIPNKSEKKEAAYAYMMYTTSKGMQDEYIDNGGIVSRTSYLTDPEKQAQFSYYQTIIDTLKQAADLMDKGYSVVIPIPEWNTLSDIAGTEGGKALVGQQTAEEAGEKIQAQVEEILP